MKQQIIFNLLQEKNPAFKSLVQRLDLDLVVDHQLNTKVSSKVTQLIDEAVLRPRSILPSIIDPFDTISRNQYLQTIYGPRPWKYPLTTAPF